VLSMSGRTEVMRMLEKVDAQKAQLDELRPLPKNTVRSLREKFWVEMTYHSNAIEGNTLTLKETKLLLEDGITVGGKPFVDHLEARNHKEAILFTHEVAAGEKQLSEGVIKSIHQIVVMGLDEAEPGSYRKQQVFISGTDYEPPEPIQVPALMQDLVKWHKEADDLHPVKRAVLLHNKLVEIHPFVDGNGRTARLLVNVEMIKGGYLPVVIRREDREQYYDAVEAWVKKEDPWQFAAMVANALGEMLETYLRAVRSRL